MTAAAPVPAPSRTAPRRVAVEDLNVAPWVQALPLAAPRRRFWAMVIDLLLVTVVGAMVLPGRPSRVSVVHDDDDDDAPVAAQAASGSSPSIDAVAAAASAAIAAASAAHQAGAARDAARQSVAEAALAQESPHVLARQVMQLEHDLAEARRPHAWYEVGWRWFRGLVTGYGSSMAYFTLVTAFWRGRTVGKRLMGLRVVEITGKPVTLSLAFTRYGGYVAGMLTGGVGLAQVLWDRNRQGLQDKVAHTLVVDERGTR